MSASVQSLRQELPDVVAQAGDWLLRLSEEDLAPESLSAWLEWYHADTTHREVFHQLQQEYERLKSMPGEQREMLARTAPAERPALTDEPASKTAPRPRASQARRLGWALAAVLVLALAASLWQSISTVLPTEADTGIVQTARGVNEERMLPDGSRLTMGGESVASFRFTEEARYVVLESGEAFFVVAKDKQRPFIVNVGGMTVRAVGTAFNIRRSSERVVVTVTEGVVDVQRTDSKASPHPAAAPQPVRVLRLNAGQEVVMNATATSKPVLAVKAADATAATAWRSGRLEFVDEPLSSVIATVNRYSHREIIITDRELARMTMTGSVMKNHVEEWLSSLPDIYPAKLAEVGDDTVLISLSSVRQQEERRQAAAR